MSDVYWSTPKSTDVDNHPYYVTDYQNFQNQPLDFKNTDDYDNCPYVPEFSAIYNSSYSNISYDDEPPLLEELEIYPDRILEKVFAVLNPFRSHSLADDAEYLTKDSDLGGPLIFCFLLAMSLLLSGKQTYISYIYGISVVSCLMMYCLLTLMTAENNIFSLTNVTSILGYCLIPIVALSILGILFTLKGLFSYAIAILAVIWSSVSASRLFVTISGDRDQQPLIAYPCALVSGVFALLIIF